MHTALAIIDRQPGDLELVDAQHWVAAQWDLDRIRQIRRTVLEGLQLGQASAAELQLLLATYRYDHRARTRRRRAAAKLKGTTLT
jgi:hypothetical protein